MMLLIVIFKIVTFISSHFLYFKEQITNNIVAVDLDGKLLTKRTSLYACRVQKNNIATIYNYGYYPGNHSH